MASPITARWPTIPSGMNYTKAMPDLGCRHRGVIAMPTYEFECRKCRHRFNLVESITEHDKHREKCSRCAGTDIQSLISAANVKTSRKS